MLSVAGFESMTPPFIVQEYRDHNESFYKVYVINDEVMIFRRPSLPNLDDLAVLAGNERNPHHTGENSRACGLESHYFGLKSVAFDSRYAYPTAADFRDDSYDSTIEQHDEISNGQISAVNHSTNDGWKSNCNRNGALNDRHNSNNNGIGHNGQHSAIVAVVVADPELSIHQSGNVNSAVDGNCEYVNGHGLGSRSTAHKRADNSGQIRDRTDSTGTVISTVQAPTSSPHACREPPSRVSVLSLEGRAKKPSAKDMPPLSAESSPHRSSDICSASSTTSASTSTSALCNLHHQQQGAEHGENRHSSVLNSTSSAVGSTQSVFKNMTNGNSNGVLSTSIPHTEDAVESSRSDCLMANVHTVRAAQDAAKRRNNTHSGGGSSSRRKIISINEGERHDKSCYVTHSNAFSCHLSRIVHLITPPPLHRPSHHIFFTSSPLYHFIVLLITSSSHHHSLYRTICIDKFKQAAIAIKAEFGLSLFGFDLIIPVRNVPSGPRSGIRSGSLVDTGLRTCEGVPGSDLELKALIDPGSLGDDTSDPQYTDDDSEPEPELELVVIDVNYFPSYKEVPDFPDRLRRFLRMKAGME